VAYSLTNRDGAQPQGTHQAPADPAAASADIPQRALLGLVRPSSGSATIDGLRYDELERPGARVGVVLEDASFPSRSHDC
jgi:hypothetical protein